MKQETSLSFIESPIKALPNDEIIESIACKFLLNLNLAREYQKTDRLWYHYNQAFNYYIDRIVQYKVIESFTRDRMVFYEGLQKFLPDYLKRSYAQLEASCCKTNQNTLVAGSIIMDKASRHVLMVKGGCDQWTRGKYGFCKGKIGQQQDFLSCAYRQITEQLRIDPKQAEINLQPHKYFYAKTDYKEGVFFLAEVQRDKIDQLLAKRDERDSNPQIQSVEWIDIAKGVRQAQISKKIKGPEELRSININAISKFLIQQIYEMNPQFQSIRYTWLHSFIKVSDKNKENKGSMTTQQKIISKEVINQIQKSKKKQSSSEEELVMEKDQENLKLYSHQKVLIEEFSIALKQENKPLMILYTSLSNGGNKIMMGSFAKILKQNDRLKKSKLMYCSIFKADKSKINYYAISNKVKTQFIYLERGNQTKIQIDDDTELILSDPYSLNEFLKRCKLSDSKVDWINSILYIDISVEMYDTDMFKIIQILSDFPPKNIILEFSYRISVACKSKLESLVRTVYPNMQIKEVEAQKINSIDSDCFLMDGSSWFPHKGINSAFEIENLLECIRSTPRIQNSYTAAAFKLKLDKIIQQHQQNKNLKTEQYLEDKLFCLKMSQFSKELQSAKCDKKKVISEFFQLLSTHEKHIDKVAKFQMNSPERNIAHYFENEQARNSFFTSDHMRFVDKCIVSIKEPEKFARSLCSEWIKNISIQQIRKRIDKNDIKFFFESNKRNKDLDRLKRKFFDRMTQKYLNQNQKQKIIGSTFYFKKYFQKQSESAFIKDYVRFNSHIHVYDALNPKTKILDDELQNRLLFCGIVICPKRMTRQKRQFTQRCIYDDFPGLIITDDLMKALTMSSFRTIIIRDDYFCQMSQFKSKEIDLQRQIIPRIFGRKHTRSIEGYQTKMQTYLDYQTAKICQKYICKEKSFFNTPSFLISSIQHHLMFPNLSLKKDFVEIGNLHGTLDKRIYIAIKDQKAGDVKHIEKITFICDSQEEKSTITQYVKSSNIQKRSHQLQYDCLPRVKNLYGLEIVDKQLFYKEPKRIIQQIIKNSFTLAFQGSQDAIFAKQVCFETIDLNLYSKKTCQIFIPIKVRQSSGESLNPQENKIYQQQVNQICQIKDHGILQIDRENKTALLE